MLFIHDLTALLNFTYAARPSRSIRRDVTIRFGDVSGDTDHVT